MKKIRVIVLAAVMVLAMSLNAMAASVTIKDAEKKALNDAGLKRSEVIKFESEKDDGKYEIEFIRKSNGAEYEYEFSASTSDLLEKSIDYVYERNSSRSKIGKKAALKKAAKYTGIKYNTVRKGTCKYKYKKGKGKYTVKFRKGNYKYEVEILAPTGKVIEYEKELVRK